MSDRSDAVFILDDVSSGNPPESIKLKPGHHEIRITRPGYLDFEKSVDLEKGDSLTLSINLKPKQAAPSHPSSGSTLKPKSSKKSDSTILGGKKSGKKSNGLIL